MDGSFIDENGVERPVPQPIRAYEDRPARWIRLVLAGLSLVFVWAGIEALDRAGGPPEESWEKVWLDYYDRWSRWFEENVVVAHDELVADEGQSSETSLDLEVVDELFLAGPPARRHYTMQADEIRWNFDSWAGLASPHERATPELGKSWDLAVLDLVGNDPTTIDLEGLAALDPREFLTRLRAQEAVAREAMQRDYDSLVSRHRVYTTVGWAFFVLAIGCIPAAVWVRWATLRAVRRDNERLRHEWRAYAVARRAAAAREVSGQSEPSGSSSPSRSITHSKIAAESPVSGA